MTENGNDPTAEIRQIAGVFYSSPGDALNSASGFVSFNDYQIVGSGSVVPAGFYDPKPDPKIIEAPPLVLEGVATLVSDYEEQGIEIDDTDLLSAVLDHFKIGRISSYLSPWNTGRRFRITVELLPEEGGLNEYI